MWKGMTNIYYGKIIMYASHSIGILKALDQMSAPWGSP